MTTVRIERSSNPSYLCSQLGPRLASHLVPDEAVITVHASEMDDEIAAALSAEATRICERHTVRGQRGGFDDVPAYGILGVLVPPEQIPGGKLAHIEIINGEAIVMLPEERISPELVTRIPTLGDGISTIYYIR
ncbi:MAG: hypothetical protein ACRDOO_27840 [Actinomadura sp.]